MSRNTRGYKAKSCLSTLLMLTLLNQAQFSSSLLYYTLNFLSRFCVVFLCVNWWFTFHDKLFYVWFRFRLWLLIAVVFLINPPCLDT